MGLLDPKLPDIDLDEFATAPYATRLRIMCESWAMDGFGTPPAIYTVYVLKIAAYIGGFLAFASATPELGGLSTFSEWWTSPLAMQKAVLWTLLFEGLGFGCGFGPLTGRYFPPMGGFLYFLRPGTTRLPPWPTQIPGTAGHQRTLIDVGLYAAGVALMVRALLADSLGGGEALPIVVVVLLLGLRDKTAFLAHRPEHFLLATFVIAFPADTVPAYKAIQLALWWGAASSKLNHHFPAVVAVMISNGPLTSLKRLRRALYRDFPNDLRPSRLPTWMAHGGTVIEYLVPLVLVLSTGGRVTYVAVAIMVVFHTVILTSFPLGVPIEWNIFFIYWLIANYGVNADVRIWDIQSPLLAVVLVLMLVALPVYGNLRPDRVSFLPSMRYYAGNWGTSLWLFRKGTMDKLDEHLVKSSKSIPRQLEYFYEGPTIAALIYKVLAFRAMHLHGRGVQSLVPRAVEDIEAYDPIDGELTAGVVLGWNFGEGHIHNESLIDAVQAQCNFAPGDLRVIIMESQPFHNHQNHWRIVDAATGLIEEGQMRVDDYRHAQPWPTPANE